MSSPHRPERTLSVHTGAGLSNRLRVLVSGLVIATETHRFFTAHWAVSNACACDWHDLFTNAWNIRKTPLPAPDTTWDLAFCRWRNLPDLLAAPGQHLGVKYHNWLLFPDRFPYHAAHMEKCVHVFEQLEPVPGIAARVQEFRQTFFDAPVIGVHLRRGDMLWLSPDTTNNTGVAMNAIDTFLQAAPDARILLCTDDGARNPVSHNATPYEGVREKFARRYGERVISTQPRSLDRRAPEAIQDALVDLWLLRETNYFVGTARSSFSELATFGRNIPHVLTSHSLPHYEKTEQRLRRAHLDGLVKRLGMIDNGEAEPLPLLWYKYSRRILTHVQRLYRRAA